MSNVLLFGNDELLRMAITVLCERAKTTFKGHMEVTVDNELEEAFKVTVQ